MLRTKPRLKYCGLTVVLSNQSRFDKVSLLAATGGALFNSHCLRPEFNSMQCDIRLADDMSPLLDGTKCVLLCGDYAMKKWLPETGKNSIGEMRGSPFEKNGVIHIPTFFPQDAADMKAYEQQLNTESKEYQPDASEYDSDDEEGDAKRHGKTARRNYAFWLRADTKKCIRIIQNGGRIQLSKFTEAQYIIYPNGEEVANILRQHKHGYLYFDIETDYEQRNLQCFAFSFDGITIYSVPVLDYNYKPAYGACHRILGALAEAIADNVTVAHNGAAFDFLILAYKYRIPVGKCYDTMLAMHRCFPDVEKSLGHCVSYWTYEKFHKDEDSQGYLTRDQMMDRLRYCAKDVRTMFLVHKAIQEYAKTVPGLEDSIDTVQKMIRPYLITTLQGIKFKHEEVAASIAENDMYMEQCMRMINLLIGAKGLDDISRAVKGKAKSFPGSNKQCCVYFHDILGYPVVARSKKTDEPSLAKNAMYKLALKHENPVIQCVLAYREVAAQTSKALNFVPWKDNDNKIYEEKQQ